MSFALKDGSSLRYWDTGGTGPSMILAHPYTGNLRSWSFQKPDFCAAGYRVIGYSRRGYFGSSPCQAPNLGTQADDLAELLDHLSIERTHLVGSAAGGSTALDFALSFPQRTLSAVIASSVMSIEEVDFKAVLAQLYSGWFKDVPEDVKELSADYRALCQSGREAWEGIRALNPPRSPGDSRQPLKSRINWTTLAANKVPLLLLIGDCDLYMPPAVLKSISGRIGAAKFVRIRDAAHAPQIEQPQAFNDAVLNFLASVAIN